MKKPIAILEPLSEDLKDLDIGEYLKSRDFKRYCIKAGIEEYWRAAYDEVQKNRSFFSVGMDHEKYDSEGALNLVLSDLYQNYNEQFFIFIRDFIFTFSQWTTESIDTFEILEDLRLLNCPDEILDEVDCLSIKDNFAVPRSIIPSTAWNSKKLEECIKKMDISILNGEFNLTLTYAYSCLEGLFKAYIENNLPEKKEEDELSKLSKLVKSHIKQHFEENDEKFPEQMLNLIGTITNAVSNARNNFSESHFDKTSDKWLAEFARDCVNSVGRLVLKFIK